jgi:hypothetical protein
MEREGLGVIEKTEKSEKSEVLEGGDFCGKGQKLARQFICKCLHKSTLQ